MPDAQKLEEAVEFSANPEPRCPRCRSTLLGSGAALVLLAITVAALSCSSERTAPPPPPKPDAKKVAASTNVTPGVPSAPGWPFDAAEARRRQAEAAKPLGGKVEQKMALGGGVYLDLVLVPAGHYVIGSPPGEEGRYRNDYEDQKTVSIEKPFLMGKYEVTQEQWQAIMGVNVCPFTGMKKPVGNVSWDDCRAFVATLNEMVKGMGFRLPTEAEREWACRAGATTRYCFGESDAKLDDYAWYHGRDPDSGSHPVGEKKPNAWGLHDMYGNVLEWCASPYVERYDGSESRGEEASSPFRVLRGGSWGDNSWGCRSAGRRHGVPRDPYGNYGFRVVCSATILPPSVPTGPAWPFDAAEARRRQAEAAKSLGGNVEQRVALGGGVNLDMVLVPACEFVMGTPACWHRRDSYKVQKTVKIEKPFWMGKYEVTQEQWEAVMGANPSSFKGPQNPVEGVSWKDCQGFIQKLNARTGRKFALPSEAEWECACRAGSSMAYCFGNDGGCCDGERKDSGLSEYAWYRSNSNQRPQRVGQKKPNAWGLFDMHGNVLEWCEDVWLSEPAASFAVHGGAAARVARGGSWAAPPSGCCSENRCVFERWRRGLGTVSCRVVLRDF